MKVSLMGKAISTLSIPVRALSLLARYAAGSPAPTRHMIAVPGFFDVAPGITWAMIRWKLATECSVALHIVKLPRQGRAGIEESANLVIERMFAVMEEHGAKSVLLAGHSWGAVVVREVMRRFEDCGQEDMLERVVRLAPPDEGTLAATYGRFVPLIGQYLYATSPSMRMMCYGDSEIVKLASYENGKVEEDVLASTHDGLYCIPWTTCTVANGASIHLATLDPEELKLVPGAAQIDTRVSHLAMLFDGPILDRFTQIVGPRLAAS